MVTNFFICLAIIGGTAVVAQISDDCISCICGLESNGNQPGCGNEHGAAGCGCAPGCNFDENSCSCGPYQIKQPYFTDCSAWSYANSLSSLDWVTCANDIDCARQCIRNYMHRYGTFCTGKPLDQITCVEFGSLHNGGPYGCQHDWTLQYRERLAQCCATQGSC